MMKKTGNGPTRFYRLCQDNSLAHRWLIDHPDAAEEHEKISFKLSRGKRLHRRLPIPLEISERGQAMDVSETSLGTLVFSNRAAQLLTELAPREAQLLDASIDKRHSGFKVVNLLENVDCLDPGLSDMLDPFPDGRIRVLKPAIDSSAAGGRNIFRIATWPVTIVIREHIKSRFDSEGITGAWYYPLLAS